jgi:hypothetical protein
MELSTMGRYFVGFLMVLSSAIAAAYPTPVDLDGYVHRWPISQDDPYVYYEVVGEPDQLESLSDITLYAAETWSSVDKSLLKILPTDGTRSAQITFNFKSTIEGGDMAAGYSIFDELDDGRPIHCSITIAAGPSSDHYNLTKTTIHELGHCLGLGHSLIPESIMSYNLEKNSLSLSADDRAAISRLYPLNGSGPKLPPGCAITGETARRGPLELLILVLSIPCLAFFQKRKMT